MNEAPAALVDELAKLGVEFLNEVLKTNRRDWRQLFQDRNVAGDTSERFFRLPDPFRGPHLFRALRRAIDQKNTEARRNPSADPIRDAELFRRPPFTSPFSGQDIAERSG